jgi:hypothetical protein
MISQRLGRVVVARPSLRGRNTVDSSSETTDNILMIEQFVNTHLESILQIFCWSGTLLTAVVGVFLVQITKSFRL